MAVAAVAIAAAILISASAVLYISESWDLDYDTDGGILPPDAPSSYKRGEDVELPTPEKDGYVFLGWYLDEGLTEGISSTGGMTGDLRLHASWIEGIEYSITYVANGGTVSEDGPDTYVSGHPVDLPDASRDGFSFGGWHTDPELTVPIVTTEATTSGDLTLYACWVDEDRSGTGYTWNVSGTYYNGLIPHTVSGTMTQENLILRDGSTYYTTSYDLTYTYPGGSMKNTSSTGGWSRDNMVSISYKGLETVGGYNCTVWTSEDGDIYWLYHMDIQVRVLDSSGIRYDLAGIYEFDPVTSFVPDISADHPLSVPGTGTVTIGDTVELTASGEGFEGWYLNGNLLSEERTISIERINPNMSLHAKTDVPYIVLPEGTTDLSAYGFGSCTVTDSDGEPVSGSIGSLEPGLYTAAMDVSGISELLRFFVDDTRVFEQSWTYGGSSYTISAEILYSDVYRYVYEHPYGYRVSMTDPDYVRTYHTADDRCIASIVGQLRTMSEGMDAYGYASFVLSLVQSIPYLSDASVYGADEYWAYPLEYLWNGGGDCEDSTIFYNTLMIASGYDAALLLFSDHAMSAVSVEGATGLHMTGGDGTAYYLCETTNTGFDIGESANSRRYSPGTVYYWCTVGEETAAPSRLP